MRAIVGAVVAAACLVSLSTSPWAASLQVSPVSIEVPAPGAATTITLRNVGTDPLNAQIRVFRWVQTDGEEKLQPTDDMIASPPIATLAPNTDYTVRLVRVSKEPIATGEAYRLLVDELPEAVSGQSRTVRLVMRYSVPVFFYPRETVEPKLAWSLEERGGQVYLLATNSGDRHMRVASLKLRDGTTTVASFGDGLLGYVLGHSTMRWQIPGSPQRLSIGSPVVISAQGDTGPINAALSAPRAR
jgi:fimbrial chaperone protein